MSATRQASNLMGALARRAAAGPRAVLPSRGGGGGPVAGRGRTTEPLAAEDELTWDDGTVNPEYCVDRWDDVGKYQALRWLGAGLGLFGCAAALAARLDKRSAIPFTPRSYPFDNLSAELAGSKGVGPRD